MTWRRLYITTEGQSERKVAEELLAPHLAHFNIDVRARVVVTNRKLGKRGGVFDYQKIRSDITRLLKEDRNDGTRFTTMIDLYALPHEFPGWTEARQLQQPRKRVTALEKALAKDIGSERFIPYIQLHEMETLLYCDLSQIERRIAGSHQGIQSLSQEVLHLEPEEINEGVNTSPSKRIINHVPVYERSKTRVGAPAIAAIGLPTLRAKCPHFAEWIRQLELLT